MTPSSCSMHRASDLRARSFLISLQDTHDGSTICRTDSDFGKSLHLTFSCYSMLSDPNQSSISPLSCCVHLEASTDIGSAYYYTVVLHLFRPFLKVDLTNSKVSPRDICTSCARNGTSLMGTYRQIYGLRRVPVLATHILLSTSIIHLLNLPNPLSAQDLAFSISSLRGITANHAFATRCLHIIMALSQQWDIHLPSEIAQIAFDSPPEIPMSLPDPQGPAIPLTHLSFVPDLSQQQANISAKDLACGFPFSAVKNSPKPSVTSADMFWSPFPDFSVPLQAHQQNGPMDISVMLDGPNSGCDQLSRDGFRMAQLGDPILSPPVYNHINDQWTQG